MLPFYSHTAPGRESDLLKQEYDPQFCRENYTLKAGPGSERKVYLGTPLMLDVATANLAAAAAAVAGNTGNGTIALADPFYTTVKAVREGRYTVRCTTGGADATSKFQVEGPDGRTIGEATGGAAFAKQVKFTISGGGTDFVAGDSFVIDVAIDQEDPTNTRVAWVPGDGEIIGLSLRSTTAPDGVAVEGLSLDRGPAILSADKIVWPDGITATEKATGIEMLKQINIIQR